MSSIVDVILEKRKKIEKRKKEKKKRELMEEIVFNVTNCPCS